MNELDLQFKKLKRSLIVLLITIILSCLTMSISFAGMGVTLVAILRLTKLLTAGDIYALRAELNTIILQLVIGNIVALVAVIILNVTNLIGYILKYLDSKKR